MHRARGGFGAQHIGCPDLHPGSAERHGCRDTLGVRDAAGGDDRDLHRPNDLRHQCERADLRVEILRQKVTAMPARFEPLRDDGINSTRFQPERFVNSCCRRKNFRAPPAYPLQQFGCGQAEMKTHDGGLEFLQHVGGCGAEGHAARPRGNGARVDSEFAEVRRKQLSPHRFAPGVGLGLRVTEEIDVVRSGGLPSDRR
ncbi:MAG: hypothetical protein CAPSK01_004600 [Candidatus Accumulibacter vicinus]|uniref:Uncharacterized protein n=1 Tax=Candidatus Accumulibacter vicinus TaxID=2954382 RepID=A0A084XUG1_9PROT|nr:MAG: hypothetical protein CAPSK01_004600 [Candidatus Accumulibacter vicinus]